MPVSGGNRKAHRQAEAIRHHMTFSALDTLATVVASLPARFARSYGLAVDDKNGRILLPALFSPDFVEELAMDLGEDAAVSPIAEIAVHGAPMRKTRRQHPPLAARLCDVEKGIKGLALRRGSRAPAVLGRRDQTPDELPLLVGQVCLVDPQNYPPAIGWKQAYPSIISQ